MRSDARPPLDELERQIERGSIFTQAVFQKSFTRLSLVEATVAELIEALSTKGVVSASDLPGATEAKARAEARQADAPQDDPQRSLRWPAIALRVDPEEPPEAEPVDCAARMHICKAVCCKLKFALSSEEVEAGKVKWDIGHPYIIRQDSTGYCCHNDPTSGGCRIYDERPGLCRRYSCRHDGRIWTDFEGMVRNEEWISTHIGGADAFLFVEDE
jgi:Fe-S-cluster containining protein